MAAIIILRYFTFLIIFLKPTSAKTLQSFSFKGFHNDANFESNFALYGDAKVVNNGSSVQLASSVSLRAGQLVYKKPIKLVEGRPRRWVSFSTYFSFSMSPRNGDGLAFVLAPIEFFSKGFNGSSIGVSSGLNKSESRIFSVDLKGNRVVINAAGNISSVRMKNVSSVNMLLKSEERLHCWIDFEAGSQRLEIRLSESGDKRPVDSLLVYSIDFSAMWKEEKVFMGLSSSKGNSSQICSAHSWSFQWRIAPRWMHSQPLNPGAYIEKAESLRVQNRSFCLLRVIAALIFGTGCGALGALVVLSVCSIFGNRLSVVPEASAVHPVDFEDEKKVVVVVDKSIKDGDN